jgi:hypothetical protein
VANPPEIGVHDFETVEAHALRAVPGKAMSVQLVKLQRAQCVDCGEMYAQSVCFLMPCIGRRKRQGNDDEA